MAVVVSPLVISYRVQQRQHHVGFYITNLVPLMTLAMSLVSAGIIASGDIAVSLLFGEGYAEASVPLRVLLSAGGFIAVTYAYGPVISAYDLVEVSVVLGVISGVVALAGSLLLVPKAGVVGAALMAVVSRVLLASLRSAYIAHKFRYSTCLALLMATPPVFTAVVVWVVPNVFLHLLSFVIILAISLLGLRRARLVQPETLLLVKAVRMPESAKRVLVYVLQKLMA
jgi:O-antigen/teichoic acid export membrane protein